MFILHKHQKQQKKGEHEEMMKLTKKGYKNNLQENCLTKALETLRSRCKNTWLIRLKEQEICKQLLQSYLICRTHPIKFLKFY